MQGFKVHYQHGYWDSSINSVGHNTANPLINRGASATCLCHEAQTAEFENTIPVVFTVSTAGYRDRKPVIRILCGSNSIGLHSDAMFLPETVIVHFCSIV